MKIKTGILYTLFITMTFSAFAQEEEEEKKSNINSNRKYKNEIGIDISAFNFLLGNSDGVYPSLFFRRHFTKEKSVKSMSGIKITSFHAYRFRVGSNLSFEKFITPDIKEVLVNTSNYYYYNYNRELTNTSSFFVRVGKEKQIRSKQFELFYGYDFVFNYASYDWYTLDIQVYNAGTSNVYNINHERTYSDKTISFGAAAIGGFKYFLIPRLCFSAEATIDLKYFSNSKNNGFAQFDTSNQEYSQSAVPLSSNGIKLSINPLFVVNIGYYF